VLMKSSHTELIPICDCLSFLLEDFHHFFAGYGMVVLIFQ
jgi:hypothetical protein